MRHTNRKVKEKKNTLQTIKERKANWICRILRGNCLLKHVVQGKIGGRIEVMERQGRRCKKLLDNLKGKKGGTIN
jgi:hypothetical protein